ncbi:SDR family oxidoreductase [Amycolatopsis magusensis]|uniref:NAD(P)-dependent dehydrogenase (Short-subunit alcohol dehydrogenase family) n=1 Tax=Amycolatopsis magusensis TaxID=882444 RepID=A0ABS4Q2P5_9PSEU|nr:SDR family oxidoreductase [Amycolatopsis magusensis]MBP2185348.1 NAD(P)-dependent dehydrogenase (short-subunit alcohol dehydrogenase family) [Amycolatopsis magusensis]MDI5981952.1 SDR family oxidoreductase [Amycolatopsis magusensis]
MDLAGKHVLITGAASGIGRATARRAAAAGARLYLTDLNAPLLAEAAGEIRDAGGAVVLAEPADLTSLAEVSGLGERIHASLGSLDVVMNIAGVSAWGTVDRLEHRHWRSMVEVNLMGPIHVLETFLPPMVAAGRGGHLVNVSSAAGLLGLPWHAAYSASKFGLRGVSEVLRFDLRAHRIGVSLVCPGGVRTPLTETVEVAGIDTANPRWVRLRDGFRRHAVTPERVAAAILHGVRRNRYLVFTSRDIQAIHLLQRLFPPGYALLMRAANFAMRRLLRTAVS